MPYPNRTATTGDPIPLTFIKLIDLPALPEDPSSIDCPVFWAGAASQIGAGPDNLTSNKPTLWSSSYDSRTREFTALYVMGVSHADYAIREAGTGASDDNSDLYEEQAFIDGMFVGFDRTVDSVAQTVTLTMQRQVLGDFAGGTASVVPANPEETQVVAFGENVASTYHAFVGAALASTAASPVALAVFMIDDGILFDPPRRYGAFRIGPTGAVTLKSLFGGDTDADLGDNNDPSTVLAHCRDATNHYFLRRNEATLFGFTICRETAWGSPDYNNYTPLFDDPDLPASMKELYFNNDADFIFVALYGTDVGFLISYRQNVSGTWSPKFILVDKEWTTVQHVTPIAGDATATTILAQGVGAPVGGNEDTHISMMMEGGYAWIIGGTPPAPLIVENTGGGVPLPDDSDAGEDDTLTIRCWPFSLDDHDFGVFRLGPSETLVFDLKTRQWSEWRSPGRTNFRAHIGTNWVGMTDTLGNYATDVVAGDDVTGVLWILDPTYGQDDNTDTGALPFTRMVIGGIALDGRDTVPCGAVQLTASLGNPSVTGGSITLRTSDDFGHSYASHGSINVTVGQFDQILEWRALGLMSQPGRIFELSDDSVARIGRLSLR